MNFSFSDWIGEVTTGHGAMILGPTLLAASVGTMSWPTAVPFLAAGVIGLLWPENTTLKSAVQTTATDIETVIAAYRTGLTHGAAVAASDAAASAPASYSGNAVSALAMLVATGLALTACANQTPAQQAATEMTIAAGLLCLGDATGKVVATATTNDSNAIKGMNSAIAAGSVLLTDTACRTALTSVVPATGTATP